MSDVAQEDRARGSKRSELASVRKRLRRIRARRQLMSMRSRLLLVLTSVILAVFISIIVIFNVLVSNYISSTSTSQLSTVSMNRNPDTGQPETIAPIPDLSQASPGQLNIRPAVFMVDSSFTTTMSKSATTAEVVTSQRIADYMRVSGVQLANTVNRLVNTDAGSYYIRCVPDEENADYTGYSEYLVYYVDVTGIMNFASRMNFFLVLIMLAAVAITFGATIVVAQRMTRPLASLTSFSQRIGKGDFTPCKETFHDQELALLANSMNHTAGQLESYDKEQKTFFQNASHELRTPLMSITCYAEGIAYGIMDPAAASKTILSETDRLSGMVEDLLSVSRIDNITNEQNMVACDVREILASVADEQRSLAAEKNLTFTLDFADKLPAIPGNDKTLHRAFSNLLSNAVRYASSEIVLSCTGDNAAVRVEISDDGPGIGPDDLPHIFERFYKGPGGNHGIGLSIVKSVAEQHHGQIQVRSSGGTTVFTMTLPRRAVAMAARATR